MVPSLEGPAERLRGLRVAPRWPGLVGSGSILRRAPGEGAPELQGEQKGIMVARMRARQSATSLLGAQARAGVRPREAGTDTESEREGGQENERGERKVQTRGAKGKREPTGGREEEKRGGRHRDKGQYGVGGREWGRRRGEGSIPLVHRQTRRNT